jgi:hypothetical protein
MDEDEKELYRMRGRLCALALVIWTLRVVTTVMGWVARMLPHRKGND